MSYFFPSITPKGYAPNLTYKMKNHEKRAHKSGGSNVRSWDGAEFQIAVLTYSSFC